MKINDSSGIRSSAPLRRKTGVQGAGGFEDLLNLGEAGAADAAGGVSDVAGISSLDGVLALQGMSDEESRRKEVVRQGQGMLDTLESLRRSLLAGIVPASVIHELDARLSRQRIGISDPKLLEVLDDIELRVAVEKAKLEAALRIHSNNRIA
jgi:hypothetical protein